MAWAERFRSVTGVPRVRGPPAASVQATTALLAIATRVKGVLQRVTSGSDGVRVLPAAQGVTRSDPDRAACDAWRGRGEGMVDAPERVSESVAG
jgi:hypothetical protein